MTARVYRLNNPKSWTDSMRELEIEFDRWDGVVVFTVEPPLVPYRDQDIQREGDDAAVIVRWERVDGRRVEVKLDTFQTLRENLRIAFLNVRDMRLIEVRGGEKAMASAYLQLESGGAPPERDPYEVLGIRPDQPVEFAEVAYKAQAKACHPDKGGTDADMEELNRAIERIREAAHA